MSPSSSTTLCTGDTSACPARAKLARIVKSKQNMTFPILRLTTNKAMSDGCCVVCLQDKASEVNLTL
eukprot:CAMPEP_0172714664 /NCGR_PEP_ID=MMETSP1074-20121228/66460_1 /TAXON_ID=2916 /ORGANISM="Ceratium fusus, Strain PA161109" /LENGTH=66 /DNA_ID=CAMNT_0013539127 /DNA_START=94 /DNA_END=291 /DNA_ORIENTATION=-